MIGISYPVAWGH